MEIFASMCLPEIARIDRVIPKKQFYENGNLSTGDKKLFENVEKIYWRYALKTEIASLEPIRMKKGIIQKLKFWKSSCGRRSSLSAWQR